MISNQYRTSISIIDEITNIRLTLLQLLGIKIQSSNPDQQSIDNIKKYLTQIDILQEKLEENYFENLNFVQMHFLRLQEEISILIQSSSYDETLKNYLQKMILFLNKYRNEANQIRETLDIAEENYRKKNYTDALDILIETLNQIKESAKTNKVPFN